MSKNIDLLESSKTIVLRKPISDQATKTRYEEITLQEPTLLQMIQFQHEVRKGTLEAMALMISLTTEVPMSAIKGLSSRDYR
ncbi:MAG: phage tail assembly protein [Enterobacteriaceae bacterium]